MIVTICCDNCHKYFRREYKLGEPEQRFEICPACGQSHDRQATLDLFSAGMPHVDYKEPKEIKPKG